ncbi:MAG: hypothetical protein H0Z24_02395 [Thermosipho sp. (in: Bacteria)]|nr:hypothetical protein [Thermosipho sp. (in: thermotogales)]
MKKAFICFLLFPMLVLGITFSLKYQQNIFTVNNTNLFFNSFQPEISYKSENFSFNASLYFSNDGKFPPFLYPFYGNYYVILPDSGIRFSVNNLNFSLGNLSNYDIVDSPYSLYFSSLGHARPTVSIKYAGKEFEYETRYVLISYYDGDKFVDKGMNFKYYAVKIGNFRFGYEGSVVYASRTTFDLDYFLNPVPNFFIQYVRESPFYDSDLFDDNSLMGFFVDYKDQEQYLYAQILFDDFNANRIFDPDNSTVDKIAWSIGGWRNLKGNLKIGFYHAGATKYTFQPSGNDGNPLLYGYTYYTETIFGNIIVDYKDNYIGYKYGENNIAFLLDALWVENDVEIYSGFEMVFSGTKSPVNPWTEKDTYDPGFNLLNEDNLEKTFQLKIMIKKDFGIITFGGKLDVGLILNKLKLVDANDLVGKPYFMPSDEDEWIFNLGLFMEINYDF